MRNAVDHGIETPELRRNKGKPQEATITLAASRTGDRFVVDVIDDGRGIDPVVVRRKAAQRGVLSADELAAMADEQAIELIFSAGFSTASEVSDISGRGVGMDIVRSTIERVGGRVSLKSRLGAGTTVRLDLPMNIATSRIMVVEASGQVFGIPMDAILETVRVTPDRIRRIKNNDGFVLRDRVIPICSLADLMKLPLTKRSDTDVKLVVVAETRESNTAIEVDAIRDRMDVVVKPMQGLLSSARGYAGTTLMGDGAVLLVSGSEGDRAVSVRRDEFGTIVLEGECAVEDAETVASIAASDHAGAMRLDAMQSPSHRGHPGYSGGRTHFDRALRGPMDGTMDCIIS